MQARSTHEEKGAFNTSNAVRHRHAGTPIPPSSSSNGPSSSNSQLDDADMAAGKIVNDGGGSNVSTNNSNASGSGKPVGILRRSNYGNGGAVGAGVGNGTMMGGARLYEETFDEYDPSVMAVALQQPQQTQSHPHQQHGMQQQPQYYNRDYYNHPHPPQQPTSYTFDSSTSIDTTNPNSSNTTTNTTTHPQPTTVAAAAAAAAIHPHPMLVLGVDISHLSRKSQFLVCAGGVFSFSLVYGYLQELISVQLCCRQLGLFLALAQFSGYTFWSYLFRLYVDAKKRKRSLDAAQRALSIMHTPMNQREAEATAKAVAAEIELEEEEGYYNKKAVVTSSLTPSNSYLSLSDLDPGVTPMSTPPASGGVLLEGALKDVSLTNNATIYTSTNTTQTLPKQPPPPLKKVPHIPMRMYIGLSILRAIDLGMTNMAMQYVNYPAKTLMKSSRVVFTMLFGVLIARRRYSGHDYCVVALMVTGLSLFMHADAHSSAVFQPIGIIMLATALMCDGAISNVSESLMKRYNVGQDEYIFRLYSIALIAISLAALLKGDLVKGLQFFRLPGTVDEIQQNLQPTWGIWRKVVTVTMFSTTGFFGSSCAAAITKEFGALTMSITSTARKATTLFLSFALFPNECTWEHVGGIVIFISSLVVKSWRTSGKKKGGKRSGSGSGGGSQKKRVEDEDDDDKLKKKKRLDRSWRNLFFGRRSSVRHLQQQQQQGGEDGVLMVPGMGSLEMTNAAGSFPHHRHAAVARVV